MPEADPLEEYRQLVEEHLRSYNNTFPHSGHGSLFEDLEQMVAAPSVEAQALYDQSQPFTWGLANFQARLLSFYRSLASDDQQRVAKAKNDVLRRLHDKLLQEYVSHVTALRLDEERLKTRGEIEALERTVRDAQKELRRAEDQSRSRRLLVALLVIALAFVGLVAWLTLRRVSSVTVTYDIGEIIAAILAGGGAAAAGTAYAVKTLKAERPARE